MTDDLSKANRRLVRRVDALTDEELAGPSLLPGWTRAHVVAHLILAGEGLTRALDGVLCGDEVPMYESQERRDGDITDLAARPASDLRTRLLAVTTRLDDALRAVAADRADRADRADLADAVFERTPGSSVRVRVGTVATVRLREVEVHHADLDAGYAPRDWTPEFAESLVDHLATRTSAALVAGDIARTWQGETGAPTVSGSVADLAWWLGGRGSGQGLTSDDGVLPGNEAW